MLQPQAPEASSCKSQSVALLVQAARPCYWCARCDSATAAGALYLCAGGPCPAQARTGHGEPLQPAITRRPEAQLPPGPGRLQELGALPALACTRSSGRGHEMPVCQGPFRAMFPARQGCAPLPWAQPEGAAAPQAARSPSPPQPRGAPALEVQCGSPAPELSQLPPRGPRPARRSTSQLNLETAVSPAHHKNSVPSEVEMHSCLPASSVLSWL